MRIAKLTLGTTLAFTLTCQAMPSTVLDRKSAAAPAGRAAHAKAILISAAEQTGGLNGGSAAGRNVASNSVLTLDRERIRSTPNSESADDSLSHPQPRWPSIVLLAIVFVLRTMLRGKSKPVTRRYFALSPQFDGMSLREASPLNLNDTRRSSKRLDAFAINMRVPEADALPDRRSTEKGDALVRNCSTLGLDTAN